MIEPGCISCRTCENIAPEVFKVITTSQVKLQANLQQNNELIKLAASSCPVNVIKYEE